MTPTTTTVQEQCKTLARIYDALGVTALEVEGATKFYIQFIFDGDAVDALNQLHAMNNLVEYVTHEGFPTVILTK